MGYSQKKLWTQIVFCVVFTVVSFCPETSCVSYRLNHKGLLPAGKTVGKSLSLPTKDLVPNTKPKRKKIISVSKNLFQKLTQNKDEMEQEAEREVAESVFPVNHKVNEPKGEQEMPSGLHYTPRSFPESALKPSSNSTLLDSKSEKAWFKPFYDCPLFNNANGIDGGAIIKPDPYDCACCYFCNWGIHYVQCCSWPLLWNQDIKSCDWHWKSYCYTKK